MAAEILSNKCDLVVSVIPLEHPHLKVQTLSRGRMVCVVPERHPLAERDVVHLKDLESCSLITHHPSIQFGRMVAGAFEAAGVQITHSVHVLQTELARSEEHTSELQSLMRISYAVFCLKKKINRTTKHSTTVKTPE